MLAFQFLGEFTSGNPPFNLLSLMGGESLMRGYCLVIKDNHMIVVKLNIEYLFLLPRGTKYIFAVVKFLVHR